MSDEMRVITNNVPRLIVEAYELSEAERSDFDYIDWEAVEDGSASASFIRYRGVTYDLGEFATTSTLPAFNPLRQWHGYHSDSFFSGVVIRYTQDMDHVIVGSFYS